MCSDDTDHNTPPLCGDPDTSGEYGTTLVEDYDDDSHTNPLGDVTDEVHGADEEDET